MIKGKQIYPKTKRVPCDGEKIYLTEKLDGSNLCIIKKENKIYIAQRKNIICLDEIDNCKNILYKGLYQWLKDNADKLQDIYEGSIICGEWLGMGNIKYPVDEFDKRFYMFAKGRVSDDFSLVDLQYNHANFIYPFESQTIPNCIGIVPEIVELNVLPTKEHLDSIYKKYCDKVKRNVEGFIINYNDNISKYVRYKNGKLTEHFERENAICC